MAANVGFKQQCPSCEAMVPVKDPKLVGKKIDCPKCKYRFVVEEPEAKDDEDEDDAKPAKKGKPGAAKDAKAKPVKGAKKGKDDEEDDEEKPRFKTKGGKGGSTKLLVTLGVAGVAVVVLAVAGFFVLSMGDDSGGSKRKKSKETFAKTEDTQPKDQTPEAAPTSAGAELADASNHLLGSVNAVVNLNVQELLRSAPGRHTLEASGSPDLDKVMGLPVKQIDRVLVGVNVPQAWSMIVVRTNAPVSKETLKKLLSLKVQEPVSGQEVFLVEGLELPPAVPASTAALGAVLQNVPVARALTEVLGKGPKLVRQHDPQTLVFADAEPMKAFLGAQGKPPSKAPADPNAPAPPPPDPSAPATAAPAGPLVPYGTLENQLLRTTLTHVEAKKPIATVALDLETDRNFGKPLNDALGGIRVSTAGVSIHAEDGIVAISNLGFKSSDDARKVEATVRDYVKLAATFLGFANIEVQWPDNPMPPVPPVPATPEKPPFRGKVTVEGPKQLEQTVQMQAKLDEEGFRNLYALQLNRRIQRLRGDVSVESVQPSPHDLAKTLKAFADREKRYPRGTVDRGPQQGRIPRPWTPEQRVSWLAELLPNLGYTETYRNIDLQKSWRDPDNLMASETLVPYFIDPKYPTTARYLRYPGLASEVAASHFVGIAGVGLDAAEYDDKNPNRGVFGYNRTTPLADVGGNTILMVQVPPAFVGPWAAGGGSTVRGVPEKNSIQPFVAIEHEGKRGTYAMMADGSVRFLAANMSDEVFKALCVVGKDKKLPEGAAPIVPPVQKKSEMKAVPALQ